MRCILSHRILETCFGALLAAGIPAHAAFYDGKITFFNSTNGSIDIIFDNCTLDGDDISVTTGFRLGEAGGTKTELHLNEVIFQPFRLAPHEAFVIRRNQGKGEALPTTLGFRVECNAQTTTPEPFPGELSFSFISEHTYNHDEQLLPISFTCTEAGKSGYSFRTRRNPNAPDHTVVLLEQAAPILKPEATTAPIPASSSSSSSSPDSTLAPLPLSMPPSAPGPAPSMAPPLEDKTPLTTPINLVTIRNRTTQRLYFIDNCLGEDHPMYFVRSMDPEAKTMTGRPPLKSGATFFFAGEQVQLFSITKAIEYGHFMTITSKTCSAVMNIDFPQTKPHSYGLLHGASLSPVTEIDVNKWDELIQVEKHTEVAFPYTEVFTLKDRPPVPPMAEMKLYIEDWMSRGSPAGLEADTARFYRERIARIIKEQDKFRKAEEVKKLQDEQKNVVPAQVAR